MELRQYELMIILDPDVDERTLAPTLEKMFKVIPNNGGTVDNVDVWGKRRLAYEIRKLSEAIYVVAEFSADSATAQELDRQLGLNENVLRTKLMRKEQN